MSLLLITFVFLICSCNNAAKKATNISRSVARNSTILGDNSDFMSADRVDRTAAF